MTDIKHISVTETARMLKKHLKWEFPGQTFWVRSEKYSGGGSVRVYWIDGPSEDEVDAITVLYEGADFDASVDYQFYQYHWLHPDGSIEFAGTPGSACTGGFVEAQEVPRPHPDAQRVNFGANYVFLNRAYSREAVEEVINIVHKEKGLPKPRVFQSHFYIAGKCKGESYQLTSADRYVQETYLRALNSHSFYSPPIEEQPAGEDKEKDSTVDQKVTAGDGAGSVKDGISEMPAMSWRHASRS